MGRLLIVANRLPITARAGEDGFQLVASVGGLATGLAATHADGQGLWIGWPGPTPADPSERARLDAECAARRLVPVPLEGPLQRDFYEGFANGVLWPLLHYRDDQIPLVLEGWEAYQQANACFADVVAREYRRGDLVWIHDYQLMLLPGLLRARIPRARIGFFLHVPFPSIELLRLLPMRDALVRGMLGADVIGFHTDGYRRHFLSAARAFGKAVRRRLGLDVGDRTVRVGVFPMGVDAAQFDALARSPEVQREALALGAQPAERLLVGIDRMDYTKGIARRLVAFERLLERHAELHGHIRLVQVAVPSREGVGAYQQMRSQLDELIGRIHGAFATATWSPIHYLYRALDRAQLVALYAAADVMLVTPMRDGMNLVAKEFVASRADERGVLVLSELAGASAQLDGALTVNPYDVDGTADMISRALGMPVEEQGRRMRRMRLQVQAHDVAWWAGNFLEALAPRRTGAIAKAWSWIRSTP
jgi:trehalose 6-phosphate synthase/phosphatase